MRKMFIKAGELSLKNGGYLLNSKDEPVFNERFISVQKHAEWVITFAEKAKGKDFVGKQADSIVDVKAEVLKAISGSDIQYVTAPKGVKRELTEKLQKEALDFINNDKETLKTVKVNKFLQQFNAIKEFEDFGLYFEEDICKLNKIYTIEEIVEAVTLIIDLVD